jgi:N-dimethylarginine dimethylaminohydrolase
MAQAETENPDAKAGEEQPDLEELRRRNAEAKRRWEEQQHRSLLDCLITVIPFIPQGRKIAPDQKALERLPDIIADIAPNKMPADRREQLRIELLDEFNAAAGDIPFDAAELESDAAEASRTLVMIPPYEHGAHDGVEGKIQLIRKWLSICHALVRAGAHVEIAEPPKGANFFERCKEVYTRDRYAMIGDTAYLPDMYEASGQNIGEVLLTQMEKELQAQGVKTVVVDGAWFEGGNVVRHYKSRTIFIGIDCKSSTEDSAQMLLTAVNKTQKEPWKLVTVPLTNLPDMYHLDTGMSDELPHGEVMISPKVTDEKTYKIIRDIVGEENIIELTDEEAKGLVTNTVNVGDTLVMTGTSDSLRQKLAERYSVVMPDDYGLETFGFGHGGVRCLTNDVPRKQQQKPQQPSASRFKLT